MVVTTAIRPRFDGCSRGVRRPFDSCERSSRSGTSSVDLACPSWRTSMVRTLSQFGSTCLRLGWNGQLELYITTSYAQTRMTRRNFREGRQYWCPRHSIFWGGCPPSPGSSPCYGPSHRLRIRILWILKFPKIHELFTNLIKTVSFKIHKIQISTFTATKFQQLLCRKHGI